MNKLKVLVILLLMGLLSLMLIGCKTTKHTNCDACGEVLSDNDTTITYTLPFVDTIIMESLHLHDNHRQLCCWMPKDTLIYSDTLRLVFVTKKNNYDR